MEITVEQLEAEIMKEMGHRAELLRAIDRIDGRVSGYKATIAHLNTTQEQFDEQQKAADETAKAVDKVKAKPAKSKAKKKQ